MDPSPAEETKDETHEDLQMINEEARRARDIVRNLLDFARADAPKPQPTDFNQLIEEAIQLVFIKSVSQKVTLKKFLSPLPEMSLDINQMKQVIVNLLNNAVQAMLEIKDQSRILTITTGLGPPTSVSADGDKREEDAGQMAICKISDTGQGITPEHMDKVFDPFFTTKEVGEGTGLGLSISYGIIEKHGGNISIESAPGKGATFTLTLPITTVAQKAIEAPDPVDTTLLSQIS
jgi:signal transduction histidine kinase